MLVAAVLVVGAAACAPEVTDATSASFPNGWSYSGELPPVTATHGMVVATDDLAG